MTHRVPPNTQSQGTCGRLSPPRPPPLHGVLRVDNTELLLKYAGCHQYTNRNVPAGACRPPAPCRQRPPSETTSSPPGRRHHHHHHDHHLRDGDLYPPPFPLPPRDGAPPCPCPCPCCRHAAVSGRDRRWNGPWNGPWNGRRPNGRTFFRPSRRCGCGSCSGFCFLCPNNRWSIVRTYANLTERLGTRSRIAVETGVLGSLQG